MTRASVRNLKARLPLLLTICFALMVTTVIFGFPAVCQAHAPKDVVLTYDNQAQNLQVKITHETPWTSHYLKKVIVKKNGNIVETYLYESQPDPKEFTYTYKVEAVPGDVIEVTATCSIFGSKTVSLTLAK